MTEELEAVPELRFPDFDEPWQMGTVGTAYRLQGGYAFKSEEFASEGIPVIRISNVTARGIDLSGVKYHPEIRNERAFVIQNGDLLIAMSGATTGKTCTYSLDEKAYLNQRVGLFRRLSNDHETTFLTGYVGAKQFQDSLSSLLVAGAQPNIGSRDIESIPFAFPSLPEQRKIAEFLTAVDERLAQLNQKKALLEAYKKGVMQQLFTQALRFQDDHGNDFPDWEEKTLGAISSFSKGCGISKADVHEDGALPCIRYGELYTHYGELIRDVKSRTNVTENDLVLSRQNDVIIPASGETHIDIATASCVTVDGVALGGDLNIIRTKQNGVFLAYYLNNACKHAIAGMAQGSSVIHLYPDQLKRLRLQLPGVKEQTKIANFLTSLDRKIEAVAAQIAHTQTWKCGLLQQMFV